MFDRKRNRKKYFDYTSDNIYFITVCTSNRIHYFGNVICGAMILNEFGKIVNDRILWLEEQYPYVEIHNFVVMPNHIHILLEINSVKKTSEKILSLSSLIGALKTLSSRDIRLLGNIEFVWQRSFHDHIVQNDTRYDNIYNYISENPKRWNDDVLK